MSQFKTWKLRDLAEMGLHRNGGILGGAGTVGGVAGLVGKQLAFSSPELVSLVFTEGAMPNGLLSFLEIKQQIEAALDVTVMVTGRDGWLAIVEDVPEHGVALTDALIGVDITTLTYPDDLEGLTVIINSTTTFLEHSRFERSMRMATR